MIKKHLSLFILSISLFSCINNEINEVNSASENKPISFRTLRDKPTTRYANDNKDDYQVYAIIDGAVDWYFTTIVKPNTSGTSGAIDETSGTYYWPGVKKVDFYAFCPDTTSSNIMMEFTVPDSVIANRQIYMIYTVPSTADEDFTIAVPATGETKSPVALTFKHMLSKVTIQLILDENLTDIYTLDANWSAIFSVVYTSGTIDATSATDATGNDAWDSTYQSSLTSYTNSNSETETCSFIILPQATVNNPELTLQITDVTINTKSGVEYFKGSLETISFTSDLTTLPEDFLAGSQYNFVITITDTADDSSDDPIFNGEITFSSSTADWDDVPVDITQP